MYIESTDAHDGSSLLINSFNKGSISSLEINKTSSSITDKHFLSDISDPKTSLSLTKSDSDFEYQEKLRKDYDWEEVDKQQADDGSPHKEKDEISKTNEYEEGEEDKEELEEIEQMKMFEERFNHYTALKRHTDKNLKSHDIEPLIQINYTSNRLTTTFKDISNNESSTSEENLDEDSDHKNQINDLKTNKSS